MNRTSLALTLFAFILGAFPQARAQAAVEAGAISASVSGLGTAASRTLHQHPLPTRAIPQPATTARTAHATRTTARRAKASSTVATAARHTPSKQGHIVGVWPKGALTPSQTSNQ
ncbi:hypothetical protein [Edaphobacter sp.]|uniref:hypothetical protein n=1 Tax=Edaphobacter sp. TaxID=1934404 RepID=UPI002DB8B34C|nr:hypothetical protein [Edaphobacter sp.]HEU5341785.1 hypothetical protein [Edaphobacter sp.]